MMDGCLIGHQKQIEQLLGQNQGLNQRHLQVGGIIKLVKDETVCYFYFYLIGRWVSRRGWMGFKCD